MSTRVVVGVNGTTSSDAALDWALARARVLRCPLKLVTVVEDRWAGPGYIDENVIRDAAAESLAAARASAEARAPGLEIHTELITGDPVVALSDAAPADGLLVLGAHHLTSFGSVITAPVGVRVAAAAKSAVALIPPRPGSGAAGGGGSDGDTTRHGVVVGVDGSPASLEAIDFAAREADRTGSTLTAVHAWQLPGAWAEAVPVEKTIIDAIEDDEEVLLSESLAGLAERYPDLRIDRRLVRGTVVDVLAAHAREASLLVVGSHGRKAFMRLLLGSVSHSMALTMAGPLVVVRHHEVAR